jgi:hypothetical protein
LLEGAKAIPTQSTKNKSFILQPNCSEVIFHLPIEDRIKNLEELIKSIKNSEMKAEHKKTLCNISDDWIYEREPWSFDTSCISEGEMLESITSALGDWDVDSPDEIPMVLWGEGGGGGGNYDLIEAIYNIARMVAAGHLSEKQAFYLDALLHVDKNERVNVEINRSWGRKRDTES